MKYLIALFVILAFKWFRDTQGLPIVDKGVFVITGVKTCQSGLGYCILGNDCTVDKEFVLDTLGGHCDGLRKAFTPRTFFTCCQYNDLNLTTTTSTTTLRTTTVLANDVSLESNETVESESIESVENITEPLPVKPLIGVITLDELLQNGTVIELDPIPEPVTGKPTVVSEKPDSTTVSESTTPIGIAKTDFPEAELKPVDSSPQVQGKPEAEILTAETQPEANPVPNITEEIPTSKPEAEVISVTNKPEEVIVEDNTEAQVSPLENKLEAQVSEGQDTPNKPEMEVILVEVQPEVQANPAEGSHVEISPDLEDSPAENKPDVEVTLIQNKPEVEQNPISTEPQVNSSSQSEEPKPLDVKTETEAESKPSLEYVYKVDGDTKIVELKTSPAPTLEPIVDSTPEITSHSHPSDDGLDDLAHELEGIYLKEDTQPSLNVESQVAPEVPEEYTSCGIPQMKQKEVRVATVDSNEMNEQVGGDIGSCWLGGLVRSPTSLFSINDPGSYICSGALVGEDTFLTSATCISRLIGNDLKLFRIILGTKHIIHPSNGVTYNGIYREIVDYKIHSNYSVVGQLRFHDIGIIKLKSRTLLEAFRQDEMQYCTLCLPRPDTDFDKCIVSGYSHPSPSNGQDSDGIVHEAEQYIETSKYCESVINTQKLNYNYDGFTCASGVSNGEACFSPRDAGSPLACNLQNTSKYFIAGLFSSGFHCGTHDAPIIYTNIKHYLSWIYQNANGK